MLGYPYQTKVQSFAQTSEPQLVTNFPKEARDVLTEILRNDFSITPSFAFCEVVLGDTIAFALEMPVVPTIISCVPGEFRGSNVFWVDLSDPEEVINNANPRYDVVFCAIPEGAAEEFDMPQISEAVRNIAKHSIWYCPASEDIACASLAGFYKGGVDVHSNDEEEEYLGYFLRYGWKR